MKFNISSTVRLQIMMNLDWCQISRRPLKAVQASHRSFCVSLALPYRSNFCYYYCCCWHVWCLSVKKTLAACLQIIYDIPYPPCYVILTAPHQLRFQKVAFCLWKSNNAADDKRCGSHKCVKCKQLLILFYYFQ